MRILRVSVVILLAGCSTFPFIPMRRGFAGETPEARAYSHALASVIYLKRGRLEEAAEQVNSALRYAPDAISLYYDLVRIYREMGDLERARVACEEAVRRAPEDPGLWMVLGWLHQQNEDYDRAVDAYRRAVSLKPDEAIGYGALIRAAEDANDLIVAVDMYRELIALRPDSGILRFQLGYALARMDDLEGARDMLLSALEVDPEISEAHNLLGMIYLDLDEVEKAIDHFTRYLASRPNDAGAIEQLAAAYARHGEYARALELIDEAVAAGESGAMFRLERLYLLLRLERYAEAMAISPPADAPLAGTVLHALARKLNGAPYVEMLSSLDGVDGQVDLEGQEVLNALAFLMGAEDAGGYLAEALTALWEEAPTRTLALLLAQLEMGLDRDDVAEALLHRAIDAWGGDKWTHYYLATIYEEQDRIAEAERHLLDCLAIDPLDPEVMNFLGYLYAEENMKLEDAEQLLLRALELDPANGFYLDSLGWVYYRMGDGERAVDLIRRAIVNMRNDDAILRDHLGDAYLLTGDVDKAVSEWRRAVRLDPTLEGVQEKIDLYAPR